MSVGNVLVATIRVANLTALVLIIWWIFSSLGGLGLKPQHVKEDEDIVWNDTNALNNWHPLLTVIGATVFGSEALLSFRTPIVPIEARPTRKNFHWIFAMLSSAFMFTGVAMSVPAHVLKLPVPYPQLFSVHSYCGTFAVVLMFFQFVLGFLAFLYPKFDPSSRQIFAKIHVPAGMLTFLCMAGAILTGLQEKATFVRVIDEVGQYTIPMVLPAVIAILVLIGAGLLQFTLYGAVEQIEILKTESLVDLEEALIKESSEVEASVSLA